MFVRADLTFKEVEAPFNLWCHSGHIAPELFSREGPGTKKEPIRFFYVDSEQHPNVNGTYCEPCLILANAAAAKIKKDQKING